MRKQLVAGIMIFILILLVIGFLSFIPEKTKAVPCSDEYYEAIEKLDATICESVTGPENEYCRDNCVKEVAYAKEDPQLCELVNSVSYYVIEEGIVTIKDFCYIHLASKLDLSLCDNMETDWAKEHCIELASA